MGPIGKVLPKVMWPVFEMPLLEAQIIYARSLGCKKIYVNIHYCAEKITEFLKNKKFNDVIPVFESELLGSGGAIHNILISEEVAMEKPLLVLNGDLFYFFDLDFFKKALEAINLATAYCFMIKVAENSAYNEVVSKNGKMMEILEPPRGREYCTFSGISIINLNRINPQRGSSQFFKTVANYREENVLTCLPESREYYDFGTKDLYLSSSFRLLEEIGKNVDAKFAKFCIDSNIIQENKINKSNMSYNSSLKGIINLGSECLAEGQGPSILWGNVAAKKITPHTLYFNQLVDHLT